MVRIMATVHGGIQMKNITIVGVGALGSHVVQFIRNVEVAIKVIDFDHVEQKNTQSQFHGKTHLRKAKVEAVKQTMNFLFGTKIETNGNKLVADNVKELLGKSDLVLDCLDNGASRRVIQTFVRANKLPCLHGAVAPDGQFGRVVWDEDFVIDDESNTSAATCENGEHLPFLAITSAYIAHAIKVYFATGQKIGFSVSPAGTIRI
jgi:hypothetical protein